MANVKILVVENESIVARDIADMLKSQGYDVPAIALSGKQAIEKAEQVQPDLVLMDIVLKGVMDGIETAGQIRRRFAIPVIYLTAYTDEQTVERARITEPFGYISKPFDKRELCANIEMALYKRKMEKALEESEAWFKRAQAVAHVGSWHLDLRTSQLVWSDETYRIFNVSIGQPLTETDFYLRLHPDDVSYVKESWAAALQGESYDIEHRIVVSGDVKWVRETAELEFDANGNPLSGIGTVQEITKRKQAEEALNGALAWREAIFEGSRDAVFISDADSRFVSVNRAACELTGYSKDELLEMRIPDLHEPQDLTAYVLYHDRIMSGEDIVSEARILRKDGSKVDTEFNNRRIRISGKAYMHTVARDITERKRADEAYRSLVDHSLQGLIIFEDGRVVFTNQAMAQITGYTVDEMIAMSAEEVRAFVHPEDREMVWDRHRRRLQGKLPPEQYELRVIRKDGLIRWLETHADLVEYQGKPAIQAAYVDVTERKRAEEQLLQYQAKLKAMASQLSSSQERQRRQLAVELHDRITQRLAMAKLGLETLACSFADADATGKMKEIAGQIGGTIEDAYSLMLELSNPVLYEVGLKAAVDTLLQSDLVKNSGIKCRLVPHGESLEIDMDVRVALYQATRELLVNAIKHSKARAIEIHLRRTHDAAAVTVQDNGVGFDPSGARPPGRQGGFGLFNIRENIGELGGKFTIESKLGEGTSARVWVPLSPKDSPT